MTARPSPSTARHPASGSSPPPQRPSRQIWTILLSTLAAAISLGASAQETDKLWNTIHAPGGPFRSEFAIQEATKANLLPAVRDSRPLNYYVAGMTILRNRTVVQYELSPEALAFSPWTYGNGGTSLDDALAKEKARYDQRSIQAGCTPNTTIVQGATQPVQYAPDGTSPIYEFVSYTATYQYSNLGPCNPRQVSSSFARTRDGNCPNPAATRWDNQVKACVGSTTTSFDHRKPYTTSVLPTGQCPVGNPCDPSTGDKMQPELDFDLGWISFVRYFHSLTTAPMGGFGDGWTHSHNLRLTVGKDPDSTSDTLYVGLVEADGSQLSFTQVGTAYEGDNGRGDRVVQNGSNWRLFRSDRTLLFGPDGRLLEQQFEDGTALTYAYDPMRRLSTITHSTGRSLSFEYAGTNRSAPISVIRSAGLAVARYNYTAGGQVETIAYANSFKRKYHYEDTRFPRYLTGVTIEGNKRYSTFAYDDKGRVISSQHDGGADGVTLTYPTTGGSVVTDALGNQTTFALTATPASGAPRRINGISETSRGTAATTYNDESSDFRRRVATTTDRKQIETRHAYTEANDAVTGALARTETITEAYGKPEQRVSTVTTDVATNRAIRSAIGSQEARITRNARLQPVSVAVRDTVTNEVRTTTYAYCEATDVAAANSTCPILGLLKSVDGPRTDVSDVTRFEYYGSDDSTCATNPALCTYRKGDLRKTINAMGQTAEVMGYDPQGRPLLVIDANGVPTEFAYNPRGWLTDIKVRGTNDTTEDDDRATKIAYEADGVVQFIDRGGNFVGFSYDNARRVRAISDGNGNFVNFTLDNAGNLKQQNTKNSTDLITQTLSNVYNTLGQRIAAKDASQNATTFRYDNNDNVDQVTDALGRVSTQSYDPLNRLSRTLQQVGITPPGSNTAVATPVETKVEYNALDQVVKVTDPNTLATTYAYNGFGDRTRLTSPDTGVTDYTYNAAGQLATKKDANDAVAHRYTYDALGRPKAIFYTATGPADVEYDYDTASSACAADETFAKGRVTAMRYNGTELQYCYNRFGDIARKVQTVAGRSFTLKYGYDRAGRVIALTYPDGAIANYTRGGDGRITDIDVTPTGSTKTKLIEYAFYQPFGPSLGWSYGNGRNLLIDSDLDYRVKSIRDNASGGLSLGYVFNEVGEIKELKDGLLSTSLANYKYDELGRLTQTLDGANSIEKYKYDPTGNRTSVVDGGGEKTYGYLSGTHRLTQVASVARGYDAVGNTISIGGTAREFVYDANDRLSQAKQNGIVKASYRYNALGERVSVANGAGAVETYTLYDEGGNWIGDYDAAGAAKQQAVWFDDAPAGLLVGSGATQSLMYVQTDHLGTPRAVIDPTRNVAVWTWDAKSETFGNSPPNQDPDLDGTAFVFNMRFPGQRFDAASGLVYNYFRDYDPATGRYIQSDPIGLGGGVSSYAYTGGNPLQRSDARGLSSVDNWENKYIHKVKAPPRSPDDWLGPVIGWSLAVVSAPAVFYGAGEFGLLWLTRPFTANRIASVAAEGAAEAIGGVTLGVNAICNTNPTTLYRAVGPDELSDILHTGAFLNRGSAEGKYFTTSAEHAASYARQAESAFGDPPYTIVSTEVSEAVLEGLVPVTVDRGIPAWVIPDNRLPQLVPRIPDHPAPPQNGH
ncbi:RHS repeat-associated core domain-containing protein [Lysobacter enzymogenes]|nr:RHS repeat-associated core domain-containing protein [Lysobacter enzymogenes]